MKLGLRVANLTYLTDAKEYPVQVTLSGGYGDEAAEVFYHTTAEEAPAIGELVDVAFSDPRDV